MQKATNDFVLWQKATDDFVLPKNRFAPNEKPGRLWKLFWSWALSINVRVKIMGIALVILLLGLCVSLWVKISATGMLEEQLKQRGVSIGRNIAARSADLILTNNLFALYRLAKDTLENNEDVRYVFILNSKGEIIAQTFGRNFPSALISVNSVDASERFHLELLETEEGLIYDVAVPIFEGRAGTARVGMSETNLKRNVAAITRQLLLLTAIGSFVGMGAAYLLTVTLTKPVRTLVHAAQAVGNGDFQQRVRPWANDEIGQLCRAFNAMAENLERTRIENAKLWEELKRKEQMRTRLLEQVISAQEEERKRVARELHDKTSQSLTSLLVGLKVIETTDNLADVGQMAADLRNVTAAVLDEVHDLALELRPAILDDLGLLTALQRYIEGFAKKFDIPVDYHTVGFDDNRLPPQTEITLYRIVQEALTNVAKHAHPGNVSVLLEHRGQMVLAIVEDDGRGFDVERMMNSDMKEKLGLYGMQERASLIGGTLTIESQPGMGTTVFVEAPAEG
ncbi:MAG: HAMP domain-containing protein, partial [Candidatus Poribacteria bacterium]